MLYSLGTSSFVVNENFCFYPLWYYIVEIENDEPRSARVMIGKIKIAVTFDRDCCGNKVT